MRIKQLELAWHSRDRTQHDDQTVFGQKDWQYRNSQKIVGHPARNGTNTVTHLLWEPRTSSFLSQPKQSWTAFEPAPARQSRRGLHSALAYSQPLFADEVLQEINKYIKDIQMGQKIFLDSIYQSMQDSAREVRLSLGRPSSHATRQQALQQVAMLKAAKEAQQTGK